MRVIVQEDGAKVRDTICLSQPIVGRRRPTNTYLHTSSPCPKCKSLSFLYCTELMRSVILLSTGESLGVSRRQPAWNLRGNHHRSDRATIGMSRIVTLVDGPISITVWIMQWHGRLQ